MEPNLRDILDYVGDGRVISLVSQNWRQELINNEQAILDGVYRMYQGDSLYNVIIQSIRDGDVDTLRNLSLVRMGSPHSSHSLWDDTAFFLMKEGSIQMVSLILPFLNDSNRVSVAGRRGILLDTYPMIDDVDVTSTHKLSHKGNRVFSAIKLGDPHALIRATPIGGDRDAAATYSALSKYMEMYSIIPESIWSILLYRYTEGRYEALPDDRDTSLASAIKEVMNVYIEGMMYASLVLSTDDLYRFMKITHFIPSENLPHASHTGGRNIITYLLSNPKTMIKSLSSDDSDASLDLKYFIHVILNEIDTDLWIEELMDMRIDRKIRYRIAERSDAEHLIKYIRYSALAIALREGWIHIAREHVSISNIISIVSTIRGTYLDEGFPEESISLLMEMGINPAPLILLFEEKQVERTLWIRLLATATAYDNDTVIERLLSLPYALTKDEESNLLKIMYKYNVRESMSSLMRYLD